MTSAKPASSLAKHIIWILRAVQHCMCEAVFQCQHTDDARSSTKALNLSLASMDPVGTQVIMLGVYLHSVLPLL